MLKQKQTVIGSGGNCWSTCIASLLDMETTDVPNFVGENRFGWYAATCKWLKKQGYRLVTQHSFNVVKSKTVLCLPTALRYNQLYIACGMSPRFRTLSHAVIYKGNYPYWDVHPDETFLKDGKIFSAYTIEKIIDSK